MSNTAPVNIIKPSSLIITLAISSITPSSLLADTSQQDIDELWQVVEQLQLQIAEAQEWKAPNTLIHMAGYADVNYINMDSGSSFAVGTFAPIFHYQVQDRVMLGTELAFSVNELGETEVEMEYFTINYFLNDSATLIMGRFLSPLGQFRQNMHPSWINKLPSAPQGFGHGGAAPNADIGLQVRGGVKLNSSLNANYAVYAGNGVAAEMNAQNELEEAHSPGFNADSDGAKNYGGRLGIYSPNIKLDLGVSWAKGKAGEIAGSSPNFSITRDWDFIGTDFTWHLGGLDIRGEYVKQSYGEGSSEAADFEAHYIQLAYRFAATKWEAVIRSSRYLNPEATLDRSMLGINYIFTSSVITKLAYENNENSLAPVDNKILMQMAYGF